MGEELYVCDADALINLWRHFGNEGVKALRRLAGRGYLKIPEGVCQEIMRGSDNLKQFVKDQMASVEVRIQGKLQELVAENVVFLRVYSGMGGIRGKRKIGDGV